MTIAFISDLHLTPDRPASGMLFEQFIGKADRFLQQLYILGDLFEYWIGDDAASLLGHDAVEAALTNTVHRGTEVFFLHGNRDFLVGEAFAQRTGCQLLPDPIVINPQQQYGDNQIRILLTHGDALCIDDIEHQQARKQMLSAKWKIAFLDTPIQQRLETATALRKKSETDKQSKPLEIMDVNQQAVEQLMREHQVNIMIHGHTHKPAAHEFMLDGKLARRYVLGDWYTQKSAIFYDHGRLTLRR